MPTLNELKFLQSLPLDVKIAKSSQRITEFVNRFGVDGVYIAFSGGKDSTVLLDLVRKLYPEVPALFINTGLEFLDVQKFIKTFDNMTEIRPKIGFAEVLTKHGYPLISKDVSHCIYYARDVYLNSRKDPKEKKYLQRQQLTGVATNKDGDNSKFNKNRWLSMATEMPFMISHKCCDVMKKNTAKQFHRESGRYPFIGTTTEESLARMQTWLRRGCNTFEGENISSTPISFWTEQDILQYIKDENLPICSVYGDIVEVKGEDGSCQYDCSKCKRTGCVYCAFGLHMEKEEKTRFQLLAEISPRQYEYCMNGGQWIDNPYYNPDIKHEKDGMGWTPWNPKQLWVPSKEGLGMRKVFEMVNEMYGHDFYRYE